MMTVYYQQVWFEGDDYEIMFTETSINDPDELPGLDLLEVDSESRNRVPSRLWDFCIEQMDPAKAETAEEKYKW